MSSTTVDTTPRGRSVAAIPVMQRAAAAPAAKAPARVANRPIIMACLMMAVLMQVLDSTIANVALPYMQGSLGATSDQITWVLTSYIVAAAIMTAPVGWLSTRVGRKRFMIICLAGFTLASMLCGIAQSLPEMVGFRLIQGVFGAGLVPLAQMMILDLFTIEERGGAMAIFGMGIMVGPIVGPTLGGYLTDTFDWRWVFYINVPIGVLAIAGLSAFLKESVKVPNMRFDMFGFLALSIGLGAFQLMLDRGAENDWFNSTETVVEAVIAGLSIYIFIVHTWLSEKPFISPRIFADVNYLASFILMFAVGMVLLSTVALLAPYLQNLGGYPVLQAGILMAPRGFGTLLSMMICGRLTGKVDARLLMAFGIILMCYSLWEMTDWTPQISAQSLITVTMIQGFGMGFVFLPLQVMAFATMPPQYRPDATSLFVLSRNIGSAVGISIMSFLLVQNTQILHARITEQATPFNRMLQSGGAFTFWNIASAPGRAALNNVATQGAMTMAYANDFYLMFWISLPTLLLLFFMRNPKRGAAPAPAAAHAAMD